MDPEQIVGMFAPGQPFAHIDPASVRLLSPLLLVVCSHGDDKGTVALQVLRHKDGSEPPFEVFMQAAEYLIYQAAIRSGAGFEKACELLVEGAMRWRSRRLPEGYDPDAVPEG